MKKVLHLLASNKFSGAENVVCTIIENLKEEYDMAYCSPIGSIAIALKDRNIKYYPITKMSIKQIKCVIKKYNPDIIHAHDYTASVLAAFSGFKGEIISHLHNNCPFATSWNLKTMVYSLTIKRYKKIVGVSNKVYDEAIFKNKMADKFLNMYNYVDKSRVLEMAKEKNTKMYDLFFIGRLTEQKNPFKFIEIVKDIKQEKSNIKTVMIGTGELLKECENKIMQFGLEKNIELLGFCENPFKIINNCKIGVMPSKWEGFGLTAIESMVLSKPVLNSGVGGLREICSENPEFICDDDYVDKILMLLDNEDKYAKFSNDAEKVSSNFTNLENYIKSLKNIYN